MTQSMVEVSASHVTTVRQQPTNPVDGTTPNVTPCDLRGGGMTQSHQKLRTAGEADFGLYRFLNPVK